MGDCHIVVKQLNPLGLNSWFLTFWHYSLFMNGITSNLCAYYIKARYKFLALVYGNGQGLNLTIAEWLPI